MRNRVALVLLFLSWPVCILHRIWNNLPIANVRWILFDKTVIQDFRWYWVYNELWLSALFILLAFIIMKKKTYSIIVMLWSLLCIAIADIFNYWFWFRRNEYLLTVEGLFMLLGTTIILTHATTRKNETAG